MKNLSNNKPQYFYWNIASIWKKREDNNQIDYITTTIITLITHFIKFQIHEKETIKTKIKKKIIPCKVHSAPLSICLGQNIQKGPKKLATSKNLLIYLSNIAYHTVFTKDARRITLSLPPRTCIPE